MRFTKIPLIATLMAVALSLLIVLPTLAQQLDPDLTDGKRSAGGGNLIVGVFANIADAELAKLEAASGAGAQSGVFTPIKPEPTPPSPDTGVLEESDAAFLMGDTSSPRDTAFRNTLYVSNDGDAFNTLLINVATATGTTTCQADDATKASVTATVKNNRSGRSITLQLPQSASDNAQGYIKIADDGDMAPFVNGTVGFVDADGNVVTDAADAAMAPLNEHGGPTWCDDDTKTRHIDDDNDPTTPASDDDGTAGEDTPVQVETPATSAVYYPVQHPEIAAPLARQEIATIWAKHGDRLTITTTGSSGQIELVVDGDGPEFTAITPEDNSVTRPSRLNFSFEVRDDDSGLRHDGQAIISNDGDYEEVNPDGDQHLGSEPLSVDPNTAVSSNGSAADIDVNVAVNPMSTGETPTPAGYQDISASGQWRNAASRAGVAYSFTASGADRDDDPYLYQLVAKDRAGNVSMTDAVTDTENLAEPFVFRVDDTEPDLVDARTGISWDSEKNREKVDRSYVALRFADGEDGQDALGDVDIDNITVVGHTIVGVIHPRKAPSIDRNLGIPKRSSYSPTSVSYTRAAPSGTQPSQSAESPTPYSVAVSANPRTAAQNNLLTLEGRYLQYVATTDTTTAPTEPTPAKPSATDCESLTVASATIELCGRHAQYEADKALYDAAVAAVADADKRHEDAVAAHNAAKEPGKDITGAAIGDPRSRVYLELAEDLAADAKPDVVVVGGAVFDLAENTNEAKTVESIDWIAPSLTVTVTGTENDRPVVNEDGSFTVDVQSDEDLRRRPVVFFVSITDTPDTDTAGVVIKDSYTYTIAEVDEASPLTQQEDENHWAKKYKRSSISSDLEDGLIGVIVLGHDDKDNSGATAGWSPGAHRDADNPNDEELNLTKLNDAGLLVEIDEQFNKGVEIGIGEVTPRSDEEGEETESSNPFVKLDFDAEDGEYEKGTFEDSHDRVDVTEITLNGDNVMEHLNRVNATQFSLVLRDLAVGSYDVEFVAEDDAGNEFEDGEFSFEVKERQPYEIDVQPGWNLISLPATPVEPAIDMVLANNQYISPVLGYQQGDWVTAIREDDGTWRGRLTEITGGFGYWVHARTFESIETMLSEVDPAGTLPTVPVTAGWNLLGVLDIFQNAASPIDKAEPPGEKTNGEFASANYEADNYFSSIDWKVSYTYDTTQSLWIKAVPGATSDGAKEILNGKGYWVWSPEPSTLVP